MMGGDRMDEQDVPGGDLVDDNSAMGKSDDPGECLRLACGLGDGKSGRP